jgi:hypothetical protein
MSFQKDLALRVRSKNAKIRRMYNSLLKRNKKDSFPPYDLFRAHIYQLDEKCHYCGKPFEGVWAKCHLEHAIPTSRGGSVFAFDNLRLACEDCNMLKGVMREDEWLILTSGNLPSFYSMFPVGRKPFWRLDGYKFWRKWKRQK